MHIVRIPKRNGKYRTIYVPTDDEAAALRELLPELTRLFLTHKTARVVHGFVPGRSPVTNAREHVDRAITVTFDLRDFFDTVTEDKLTGILPADLTAKVLVDGAARQGLPTSPMVANLAACFLDQAIIRWVARSVAAQTVYTRYADDLTISTNDEAVAGEALTKIPDIVDLCGFSLAAEKTHVYLARAGRRMVTGVAVDNNVFPTRRSRRRLRAAQHQGNRPQAEGLREWHRLRLPRELRRQMLRDLRDNYGKAPRGFTLDDLRETEVEVNALLDDVAAEQAATTPPEAPSVIPPSPERTRSIVLE